MRERLAGGGAPPPALASALLPPHRAPATLRPTLYPLRGVGAGGGGVRPGVGGAHSHPRGTKGRAGQRALPPASQPAAMPWQRLPGWTRQRSASAQGWRDERRAAHDCGHGEQKPGAGHRRTKRLVPEYQVLNQHGLGVCLAINPARGYGGVKIRTHV